MRILFEDNHLLIVDKPAGLLTQPTKDNPDSLQTRAQAFLKQRGGKPGGVFLEPIHRIDKPVSGIVVFAKTSKALSRLMRSMREKECEKIYRAVVSGKLTKKQGTLCHTLVHGNFRAHVSQEGKPAILHYRVVQVRGPYTEVEIVLETGRYHQIRAQFASVGCLIVGDHKYGSKEVYIEGAIALAHSRFTFSHPVTKERITIECEPSFFGPQLP